MSFIADSVYDNGLSYATTNGTRLDICTSEPTTYAGVTGSTVGNKTVTTGAPQDGATSGRRVVVPAITDGSVTGTATATSWALTDGVGELLAAGPLNTSQAVTSGNTFTLDATSVTINDATV